MRGVLAARGQARPHPWSWVIPLAVYAVILALSSIPGDDLAGPSWISYVAHPAEYAALGAALWWGWGWWAPLPVGLPLAAFDEWYQATFVAGRQGEVIDLVLDLIGLLVGWTLARWWVQRRVTVEGSA